MPTPTITRLGAALNAIATGGHPFTIRARITSDQPVTDLTVELPGLEEADQPTVTVDGDVTVVEFTAEQTERLADTFSFDWAWTATLDGTPTPILGGTIMFAPDGTPGAETDVDLTVPVTIDDGDLVIQFTTGGNVAGVGITRLVGLSQADYDELPTPRPATTVYFVAG